MNLTALPPLFSDVISLNIGNNSFIEVTGFPSSYSTILSLRMDFCGLEKISTKVCIVSVRWLIFTGFGRAENTQDTGSGSQQSSTHCLYGEEQGLDHVELEF